MRIGELSQRSGFTRDTIRFYEKMGLIRMPRGDRNRFQFKDYPETVLRRLVAIRQIKDFGFTLQETLALLVLYEEGVLEQERGLRYVQRKIEKLDQQIREMVMVRSRLQQVMEGSRKGSCPIDRILEEM
jgi:DNA-binding transcriptional MerR regulator